MINITKLFQTESSFFQGGQFEPTKKNLLQNGASKSLLNVFSAILMLLIFVPNMSAQTYCTPVMTSACSSNDYIENVSTTGGATNFTNNLSGCNGNPNNFIFYSAISCSQVQGQTINVSMQAGSAYGQGFRVWIDWNADGDFADAGEDVYSAPSGNGVNTGTVTVPMTALPGATRMRVMCRYATTPNSTDACATSGVSYGETEDYVFNVIASAPCVGQPLGGTAVASDANPCPAAPISIGLTGSSNASGLTYQWQSSASGTGYTDIVGATSPNYGMTTPVAGYYQCVVTCTASGLSATSSPVQVTINSFVNCYCTSNATSASYEVITNVSLGNLNNSSSCGSIGGPGSIADQYSDYTNTAVPTAIPYLVQGITYPTSVGLGSCSTYPYNNGTKVWIDYNQNGDFTDAGEEVHFGTANGDHVESFNLIVPNTALTGITRMRIVNVENGTQANITPCGTYLWGETEDYFVQIVTPLNDDAGISGFVTPSLPTCSFNDSVRVTLTNFGLDTLVSAQINWEWNTNVQPVVSWTGSIAPFSSQTVTLGMVALASGDGLLAYSTMPNGVIENPSGSYNDSSTISNLQSGLSGIYTIGGVAPDYTDVTSAVADLALLDICGPVVFDIADGVYTEQVSLPALANSSATNTVTFRSANADSALVTIEFGSANTGDNYVVNMAGVNNYHFENLTLKNTGTSFSTVVNMNGSSMNSFKACHMISSTTTSTLTNTAVLYSAGGIDSNNVFLNNTFENGSHGSYWYGSNTTTPEKGNVFEGNVYHNNYYRGGMYYYNEGLVIKDNKYTIDAGANAYLYGRYAIYANYATGAPQITGNLVRGSVSSGWTYGIYLSQGGGNNSVHGLIANNMVQTGYAGNTNGNNGIYLTGSGYMDVYHNSSLSTAGSAFSRAFYATSGGGIEVMNNIFANYGGGHAYYVGSTFTVSNSDYNVLYAPAGNAGYFGSDQATLTDWKNASSYDAHSIDYNPNFISSLDLHVCSDSIGNQGTPIASITTDIDGHPRSTTAPDMGADEYNGLNGSFLGNNVVFCANDSVQLWAGSPTDTILWSTGETTSSIWVNTPGSYTVTVQSACGSGTDAIVVSASAVNYAGYMAASDVSFCNGDSVLLYSTQSADTYSWTGGTSNDSLYVTAGGTYTLDITDGCGSGSEALTITMNDVPATSFSHSTNYLTGIFANTTIGGANTTYLWNFGDGTTSTDQSPSHLYSNSGLYYATLTVTNDCGSMTFGDTVNLFVLGLEDVADFGTIIVSPNPSTGMFNVNLELNETMNLNMIVTNVMGQVVSTKVIDAASGTESTQIDLSTEAAGVYYLNILSGDKKLTNKMLIKK